MATMPHARRRKPILCADFGAFFRQIGSISSLSSLILHSDKSKARNHVLSVPRIAQAKEQDPGS